MNRHSWWFVYAAGALVVVLALAWVSTLVVRLERGEVTARADAEYQESVRLALWRMDSWLAPRLARESSRPYFEYLAFYPQRRAYTRLLNEIEPGEVLTPSPLLSFESEYFRLHFQMTPDGDISSPQAPTGNLRDLAESTYLAADRIDANRRTLERVSQLLPADRAMQCVFVAESSEESPADAARTLIPVEDAKQTLWNQQEQLRRQQTYASNSDLGQIARQAAPGEDEPAAITVGAFVPVWTDASDEDAHLTFVRRVNVQQREYLQGFLCDWSMLRAALVEQVADLFPRADLVAVQVVPAAGDLTGRMLATIPVALEVPTPAAAGSVGLTPVRSILLVAWAAVIAGLVAVAVTLRASVRFGDKRSRFASAVTHELRTPLTTFRMYTEMLADDMVPNEDDRRQYLSTLRDESNRLSALVENVLSYARLEDGRHASARDETTVGDMLSRLTPTLERRASGADMNLVVTYEASPETRVETDVDAVGQILFNLVDNACKYAAASGEAICLNVSAENGSVHLDVRDNGPGIGDDQARRIFAPFDRGGHDDSNLPGIGLGLALSAGLARDLGGRLSLMNGSGPGACFRLELTAVGLSA